MEKELAAIRKRVKELGDLLDPDNNERTCCMYILKKQDDAVIIDHEEGCINAGTNEVEPYC